MSNDRLIDIESKLALGPIVRPSLPDFAQITFDAILQMRIYSTIRGNFESIFATFGTRRVTTIFTQVC